MNDYAEKRGKFAIAAGLAAVALGCGGGGGPAPKAPESQNLYVKSFSHPNYSGVLLDEEVRILLSAPVREDSINPDSVQIRTGTTGGTAPFGTFVRGVFMVDPATGNRVVVDPDRVTENLLRKVENTNDLTRIPDDRRLDLGYDEPSESNGGRLPLFDRSQRNLITFIPEIPTRLALDDTGYIPSATYTVVIPGYPASNTLENLDGDQLFSPNSRIFTSTFQVVPNNPGTQVFLASENSKLAGLEGPRIIHSSPFNGSDLVPVTEAIRLRFSQPLDPRTVTLDKFNVQQVTARVLQVPSTSVSAAADTFTAASHGYTAGTRVRANVLSGGTMPAPLAADTDYYVVGVLPTTFQLAPSASGAAIDLTTSGSGTITFTTPLNITLPISVFLAQQRLGKVEVTITPINPLPADSTIQVTVSPGVQDLLARSIAQSTVSFFTGTATSHFNGPFEEKFDEAPGANPNLDPTSTANWNLDKPYLGGVAGECVAAFAPYGGDGSDGALGPGGAFFPLDAGGNLILDTGVSGHQRIYNFTSVSIPAGASVNVTGSNPLVIHCQGSVDISGDIFLSGLNGADGINGIDNSGSTTPTGGLGGAGGAGGSAGGDGAFATISGASANFDGKNGAGPGGGKGGFSGQNTNFPGDITVPSTAVSTVNGTFTMGWILPPNLPVQVSFSIGGTLPTTTPTQIVTNTTYFVVSPTGSPPPPGPPNPTVGTFRLATTANGAPLAITNAGSGTFTFTPAIFLPPNSAPPLRWPRPTYDGTLQTCVREIFTTTPPDYLGGRPLNYTAITKTEGGGGGGYALAGTGAGNNAANGLTQLSRDGATVPNGGDGGPAWGDGSLSTVYASSASVWVKDTSVPGGEKNFTLTGIPTLAAGSGGSGGGGGGGEDDDQGRNTTTTLNAWGTDLGKTEASDDGGGGGGGGGGALQIVTYGDISMSGRIFADGGKGGSSWTDGTKAALGEGTGGGGGSGGTVWLQCRGTMSLQAGVVMSVAAGIGGQGKPFGPAGATQTAGTGAPGRVRLEDSDGSVANAPAGTSVGTFAPPLDLDSVAISSWHNTGIFTPDFLTPTIDADVYPALLFNGTIQIYMEGAPENITTTVDDPDTGNTTGWILVYDSTAGGLVAGAPWDALDNHKHWRFKIEFHVNAAHTFTDPLPTVRNILFDIGE